MASIDYERLAADFGELLQGWVLCTHVEAASNEVAQAVGAYVVRRLSEMPNSPGIWGFATTINPQVGEPGWRFVYDENRPPLPAAAEPGE